MVAACVLGNGRDRLDDDQAIVRNGLEVDGRSKGTNADALLVVITEVTIIHNKAATKEEYRRLDLCRQCGVLLQQNDEDIMVPQTNSPWNLVF